MSTYEEYYRRAPEVVLKAVEQATEKYSREVSLSEVEHEGLYHLTDSESVQTPYGHSPFSFPDRLRRWLRRLVRQGRLLEEWDRNRQRYVYLPTHVPEE
jgi:hypothetical protein